MTGRDSDPSELHQRFEELLAGMNLEELKALAGQILSFPDPIFTKLSSV